MRKDIQELTASMCCSETLLLVNKGTPTGKEAAMFQIADTSRNELSVETKMGTLISLLYKF